MSSHKELLLKGGRVITAADDFVADLLARNGRITTIGRDLDAPSAEILDCSGKYILPGCVDPHTHMDTPIPTGRTCDDFTTGTVAAAFGGTTTIIDFCQQYRGETLSDALATWHRKLDENPPVIDVSFHISVSDLDSGGSLEELSRLPDEGITSYKVFLAYKDVVMLDDETLFRVMRTASDTGALVMVHAENGGAIEVLVRSAVAEGRTAPIWHARTRPSRLEGEATHRAIQLAQVADCPVYFVHVSCIEAIEAIDAARRAGFRVWGETCPHYLRIDETVLEGPREQAARFVYTPPPRPKEHQAALWEALKADVLSVVSTDHGPFMLEDKLREEDFSKIPNGAIGVEQRLMLLHEFGVRAGHLSLNRMVDLLSTSPSRLFGLYPKKGTVAIGSDADLVIFDPSKELRISAATHHSRVDYNLFEGTKVVGAPEAVLVRGELVVKDGEELVAAPGHGQFIRRARFGHLQDMETAETR